MKDVWISISIPANYMYLSESHHSMVEKSNQHNIDTSTMVFGHIEKVQITCTSWPFRPRMVPDFKYLEHIYHISILKTQPS